MNWYDHAEYYDILFGWDPTQERTFLLDVAERFGRGAGRALEPFCGTGRLLRTVPNAVGFDLNPAMVRLAARHAPAFVADAAHPPLAPCTFDLAFCLIDSFRHLLDEAAALGHLTAIRRALRPGGVYVLGLDVSNGMDPRESREVWTQRRGPVEVRGTVEGLGDADLRRRRETMRVTLDVDDRGTKHRLRSEQPLRLYTPAQLRRLVADAGFDLLACFDRRYDLERPKPLERVDGSAVLVLRTSAAVTE